MFQINFRSELILLIMNLRLFRGISVPEDKCQNVINDIKNNGLDIHKNSDWKGFIEKNLKSKLEVLYRNPNLTRKETSPESIWVSTQTGGTREYIEGDTCICFADKIGAEYYAVKHNRNRENIVPLIIEATIDIENIYIDGRDLLYTIISQIDTVNKEKLKRQKDKLIKIFGESIIRYIDKVESNVESERIAICDLIIQDNQVILDHYQNEIILGGRCNTVFCSAFLVPVPIKAEMINNINRLQMNMSITQPQLTLHDILEK